MLTGKSVENVSNETQRDKISNVFCVCYSSNWFNCFMQFCSTNPCLFLSNNNAAFCIPDMYLNSADVFQRREGTLWKPSGPNLSQISLPDAHSARTPRRNMGRLLYGRPWRPPFSCLGHTQTCFSGGGLLGGIDRKEIIRFPVYCAICHVL